MQRNKIQFSTLNNCKIKTHTTMAKKKNFIGKEEFKQLILGNHEKYDDKFELTEEGLAAIYNALYNGDDGIEFRDALYSNPNGLDEDTKIIILGLWREFIADKIMDESVPAEIVKEVYEGEVANHLGWGVDFATNGDNTDTWAEKISEICGVTL